LFLGLFFVLGEKNAVLHCDHLLFFSKLFSSLGESGGLSGFMGLNCVTGFLGSKARSYLDKVALFFRNLASNGYVARTRQYWNRYDTRICDEFLKIYMTRVSDTRFGHVCRTHDKSVHAT